MPHPRSGMIVNCAANPIATALGIVKTLWKSPSVRVIPMPSMTAASPQTIQGPVNQVNHVGCHSARTPPVSTQTGNAFVKLFRTRDISR